MGDEISLFVWIQNSGQKILTGLLILDTCSLTIYCGQTDMVAVNKSMVSVNPSANLAPITVG